MPSVYELLLLAVALFSVLPLIVLYLRNASGLAKLAAALSCLAVLSLSRILWYLIQVEPGPEPTVWIRGLVAAGVLGVLSGYLISFVVGRDGADGTFHFFRPTFNGLLIFGVLALGFVSHSHFVTGFEWTEDGHRITFGYVGKAFLSYLLVGIVATGYNLESTYRVATGAVRKDLRIYFVCLFALLGFSTYVFTSGLLYSFLPLSKLLALVVPIGLANLAIAHGFMRGKLLDAAVPVSRAVVYSSFTAFAAGVYLLAIGLVAQIAVFAQWSPNALISISLLFAAILFALLMVFSNRVQRQFRRLIDRNFYVKRHDYQGQWSRVTASLDPSQGEESLLKSAEVLFSDVFTTDSVTIGLRDRTSSVIRPILGKGSEVPGTVLHPVDPLCRKLLETRRSLLLDRHVDDFEYLPIYVEDHEWLNATASQIVAPLLMGDELLGTVGVSRSEKDDPFSFEDVELMDNISAQVAVVLRGIRLTDELSEVRETELLDQWSSVLLHDLKNQLVPLQLLVRNIETHNRNPDFLREAAQDIAGLSCSMEALVGRLSDLKPSPKPARQKVDVNELVKKTVKDLYMGHAPGIRIVQDLRAGIPIEGDVAQLESVLKNLIVNAMDAVNGNGKITVMTKNEKPNGNGRRVILAVADTGAGMDPEFARKRLFTPFATTKKNGAGLGLFQCRKIVRAHGGEIQVDSSPGVGTCFEVFLMAVREDGSRQKVKAMG